MTLSQELETAREKNKIYEAALGRIQFECKTSSDDDAEIRDFCYFQADAAFDAASSLGPEARVREALSKAG